MIEYRAIVRSKMKFEGGFKLEAGTYIYVRETPDGWIGSYYTDKGSVHSFAIDEGAFSILRSSDCQVEFLVAMPEPEKPPKVAEAESDLARRRIESQIKRHKKTAAELTELLKKGEAV